jgi:hypothetical protein
MTGRLLSAFAGPLDKRMCRGLLHPPPLEVEGGPPALSEAKAGRAGSGESAGQRHPTPALRADPPLPEEGGCMRRVMCENTVG